MTIVDGETRIAWLTPEDAAWPQVLSRFEHDVYHLPRYAAFSARHEGGEPSALWVRSADAELFMPLLVRDIPGAPRWRDASSPYGYPSPLVRWRTPEGARSALEALRGACEDARIVSVFARLHPLLSRWPKVTVPSATRVRHGATYWLDLSDDDAAFAAKLRRDHKHKINRSWKQGYTAVMNDWSHFAAFEAMYAQTMRRVGAGRFYFFTAEYFEDLRATLGDALSLCSVVGPDGDVASGGLFLSHGEVVQFHLSCTADAHVRQSPARLLTVEGRRFFRERGARVLNLGGGVGGKEDALAYFKAGFGGFELPYDTVRFVTHPRVYAELTGARDVGGFFPAYRAPVS